jgi:hypothetical protein
VERFSKTGGNVGDSRLAGLLHTRRGTNSMAHRMAGGQA